MTRGNRRSSVLGHPREASSRALDAEKWLAEEAKERQREHGGTAPGTPKTLVEQMPQVKARDQAGALLGVSGRYVSDAKAILEAVFEGPGHFPCLPPAIRGAQRVPDTALSPLLNSVSCLGE